MKLEKACYSYSKLCQCADMVKAISWTVSHKVEHFSKWAEIEKAYQFAADNINRFIFDPDIELKQYREAAYNCKAHTKKELDSMLRQKYLYICNELNSILIMIRSGEVDSCD